MPAHSRGLQLDEQLRLELRLQRSVLRVECESRLRCVYCSSVDLSVCCNLNYAADVDVLLFTWVGLCVGNCHGYKVANVIIK